MLKLPETTTPACILPVASMPDASLLVYDGLPDDQDWLGTALFQSKICCPPRTAESLEALAAEPLGAPFGPDDQRSARVSRVTGVVTSGSGANKRMDGFAIAHGCCYAYWESSQEGNMLVVEFQMPATFGSAAGKDTLAQEQLMVRCLRQYEAQAISLLDRVEGAGQADCISVAFEGDWDESTALLQRRLAKTCVMHWADKLMERPELRKAA